MKDFFQYWIDNPDHLIALVALIVAIYSLYTQRKHDRVALRPLCTIIIADFDEYIKIRIKNAGVGPMVITSVITEDDTGYKVGYPIEFFEKLPFLWDNFSKTKDEKILAVGDDMILLHYKTDQMDDQTKFQREKDIKAIRQILNKLTISVYYKDIYGKELGPVVRDLTWFGRPDRV